MTFSPEGLFTLWGRVNGTIRHPSGNALVGFVNAVATSAATDAPADRASQSDLLFSPGARVLSKADITTVVPAANVLRNWAHPWHDIVGFLFAVDIHRAPLRRQRGDSLTVSPEECEALYAGINGSRSPLDAADLAAYLGILIEEGERAAADRLGDRATVGDVLREVVRITPHNRKIAYALVTTPEERNGDREAYLSFVTIALEYLGRVVWHDAWARAGGDSSVPLARLAAG